eukprot:scaffold29915_cov66-Phaeocystis_antarctica.AAC.1
MRRSTRTARSACRLPSRRAAARPRRSSGACPTRPAQSTRWSRLAAWLALPRPRAGGVLVSAVPPPPAWKFVGGRSGSGTTRPRARPRAECSTDSRCRSKPVVMAPQCKPRNGRAPSTPRVSSSSPQVRPAAVVPPRSVSSGKQLRGRIPGLRTLQHADFHILSTIASAHAPSFGALHSASHMCGTRV